MACALRKRPGPADEDAERVEAVAAVSPAASAPLSKATPNIAARCCRTSGPHHVVTHINK